MKDKRYLQNSIPYIKGYKEEGMKLPLGYIIQAQTYKNCFIFLVRGLEEDMKGIFPSKWNWEKVTEHKIFGAKIYICSVLSITWVPSQ